jgi:hypothetical protein
VPAWVQIIVWGLLVALLALVFVGLPAHNKAPFSGSKIPDFSLNLFSGYEYQGSQHKSSRTSGQGGGVELLGFMVQTMRTEAAELQEAWSSQARRSRCLPQCRLRGYSYRSINLFKVRHHFPEQSDLDSSKKNPISQIFRIKGVPKLISLIRMASCNT